MQTPGVTKSITRSAQKTLGVRKRVILDIDQSTRLERAQLGPGDKRPVAQIRTVRRRRVVIQGWPSGVSVSDTTWNGERDCAEVVPAQHRHGDGPQAGPGIVEAQNHGERSGVRAVANQLGDDVGGDGAVAVLGEKLQAGLEDGACDLVQVKHRE